MIRILLNLIGDGSGGGKKSIVAISMAMISITSCSIKKEKDNNLVRENLNIEEMLDSDGDGIPDSIENNRGSNPYIADIPRIKVSSVSDVAISGTFRTNSDEENYISKEIVLPQSIRQTSGSEQLDKDYYKTLRSKVLVNQVAQIKNIEAEKEDLITNEDLRTNILSSWENEIYFKTLDSILNIENPINNESGKVSFNFKIKLTETLGVTDVSNIKLKTFFYDYKKMEENDINSHSLLKDDGTKESIKIYKDKEANPVTSYRIISSDLSTDRISDSIKARNEIGIKFTDYDYNSSGLALNYSTVLQKALDRDAKVIFSNGDKTEVFFISPVFSLEESLKMIGKKILKNAKGEILSIDGVETNASLPIDFDNISKSESQNGIWSLLGNANNLTDKLVERGFYIISFAKIDELINAAKTTQIYPEKSDSLSKNIKLDKITKGDELDIVINSIVSNSYSENITTKKIIESTDNCKFIDPMLPPGRKPGCNNLLNLEDITCELKISNPIESVEPIYPSKEFILNHLKIQNEFGEDVEHSMYVAKNRIHISFDKYMPLQRNNLFISFYQDETRKLRNGVIESNCSRTPNFSIQNYPVSYLFSKDATIFTQSKY